MSYDVFLSKKMMDIKTKETEFQAVDSFHYTSNLCQFFRRFFDGDQGLFELNDLSGDEIKLAIDKFYDNLDKEDLAKVKQQYDPSNEWGSVEGALKFLDSIRETARKNPSVVCFVHC